MIPKILVVTNFESFMLRTVFRKYNKIETVQEQYLSEILKSKCYNLYLGEIKRQRNQIMYRI